jgi:hypothetical protein
LCPRCEKQSSFDNINNIPLTYDGGYIGVDGGGKVPTFNEQATVLECRHCGQRVLVLEEKWIGEIRSKEKSKGGGNTSWRGFHWWPLPGMSLHISVPNDIASAFNEAVQAIAAKCPRAAVVMARRTLEAITVDQGESSGSLAQRLRKLSSNGVLHPTLSDWAKEVRLIGNSGAHFDPIDEVSIKDAEQLTGFLKELLNYLYVLPHELHKRRIKQT